MVPATETGFLVVAPSRGSAYVPRARARRRYRRGPCHAL